MKASKLLLVFFMIFAPNLLLFAQTKVVKGVVKDAVTREAIPFVTVFIEGTTKGVTTDVEGEFAIKVDTNIHELQFSMLGYRPLSKKISSQHHILSIQLEPDVKILGEIVVKQGKKERYRNRKNPAVDLIRKVIDNKVNNRNESHDYLQYEQYDKIQFSISNSAEKKRKKKGVDKYKFMFDNQDTTKLAGRRLLPFFIHEKVEQHYYRKNPRSNKTIVKADKSVDFGEYIDNSSLDTYLSRLYQDFDIYENNLFIMTNEFLSPIADIAPSFYKYFISDTITIDNKTVVGLSFIPRNKTDFLFQGKIYVALDSSYAVQRLNMTVNKEINLNWVKEMYIDQDFEKGTDQKYHLKKSRIMADFGLFKGSGGLFGERTVSFSQFEMDKIQPDSIYDGPEIVTLVNAKKQDEAYWLAARHDSLSAVETKTYTNIDSLKKMTSFRRTMDIISLSLFGYKNMGLYEIGPVNSFYSYNPVEGFRLRFGGRTTPEFNKSLYFETYGAYGFKDEKWKYFLSTTYALNRKSIFQFPVHSIKAAYQYDTKIPGQELQFIQEDNFLLSFKRGLNNKWLYNYIFTFEYLREMENHFSYKVGFKNWTQIPAGAIRYVSQNEVNTDVASKEVVTTEIIFEFRYAPKEQFYQTKLYRVPLPSPHPVYTLRFINGTKGLVNGQYNYQNLTLNLFKRFYLSQLGYTDIVGEGGYIFGKVPFPLLTIHRANQTYAYQLNSYNLMNFLEFVSDHYVSINIDHYFNGFIFNKLPLIKKLKLREVITFKALYGSVRNENRPENDPSLFAFPTVGSEASTYTLDGGPYAEASIGIYNIFNVLRLDYVKRLTYLNHPFISDWGIRGRVVLEF